MRDEDQGSRRNWLTVGRIPRGYGDQDGESTSKADSSFRREFPRTVFPLRGGVPRNGIGRQFGLPEGVRRGQLCSAGWSVRLIR